MRQEQQRHMPEIAGLDPTVIQVPYFPQEIKGISSLKEIASYIYGEADG